MRLPIVQFSSVVIDNLLYLTPVFQTEEQVKHFCEPVTGLIIGDKKTVASINALFLNNNDHPSRCYPRSCSNVSTRKDVSGRAAESGSASSSQYPRGRCRVHPSAYSKRPDMRPISLHMFSM
jgi:hypothetical protein